MGWGGEKGVAKGFNSVSFVFNPTSPFVCKIRVEVGREEEPAIDVRNRLGRNYQNQSLLTLLFHNYL